MPSAAWLQVAVCSANVAMLLRTMPAQPISMNSAQSSPQQHPPTTDASKALEWKSRERLAWRGRRDETQRLERSLRWARACVHGDGLSQRQPRGHRIGLHGERRRKVRCGGRLSAALSAAPAHRRAQLGAFAPQLVPLLLDRPQVLLALRSRSPVSLLALRELFDRKLLGCLLGKFVSNLTSKLASGFQMSGFSVACGTTWFCDPRVGLQVQVRARCS